MTPIRVALVEDIDDIREAMEFMVSSEEDLQFAGTFQSGEAALEKLPAICPDVVLMDIHLGGISGIDCVRQLRASCPETQFLMCTVYEDDVHIFDALKAGATGYVMKSTPASQLMDAIRELHSGGSPMSPAIARRVLTHFTQPTPLRMNSAADVLTERERDVLDQLSQGYLYKELADRLSISIDTVKRHCNNIYKKLQVSSRTEALNKVYR